MRNWKVTSVASIAAFLILLEWSHAFVPTIVKDVGCYSSTMRLNANSENIRAAIQATQQYGIHSPQARVAWEVVEEMDAQAAHEDQAEQQQQQAFPDWAWQEFQQSLQSLQQRKESLAWTQDRMQQVAQQLAALKLTKPADRPAPQIPGLWDAKLYARAMTQQHGVHSPQAKWAWEQVEEIAANGLASSSSTTTEDGVAAEAMWALEELDRFLYQQSQQQQAQYYDSSNNGNENNPNPSFY